ncbi:reelin domain-containing protein 1-like [Lethenteron reissneri]|uniref:reelin domain-containing protein 1-like n=1 Tax=Lethenteron reissneri TaxID=7753 RepID=UPI002AB62640|nr:reelin domain-containing protein 1-like [Lethenteron reissneri]
MAFFQAGGERQRVVGARWLWAQLLLLLLLLQLLPSALAFSRGADPAACLDGRPRHVGARTQPPGTAAARIVLGKARYRPGEHVPVIIRSSRDFMGFLLQARSVPTPRVSGDSGPGDVRLVGTFTHRPAGTHLLRCPAWGQPPGDGGQPQLAQGGASVTHTDKSLKRNLSFVWRAPVDGAHGDVRFMASIVQSYFVFWSDVESPILRAHHDPSGDDSVQNEIDLAADDGGGDGKGMERQMELLELL